MLPMLSQFRVWPTNKGYPTDVKTSPRHCFIGQNLIPKQRQQSLSLHSLLYVSILPDCSGLNSDYLSTAHHFKLKHTQFLSLIQDYYYEANVFFTTRNNSGLDTHLPQIYNQRERQPFVNESCLT